MTVEAIDGPRHVSPDELLAEFLAGHFSTRGLRWFVKYRTDGSRVVHDLPGEIVGARDFAASTVEILKNRGMVDRGLFIDLLAERPRARDEITRIAGAFGVDTRGFVPAQASLPRMSIVATVESIIVATVAGYAIYVWGSEHLLVTAVLAPLGLMRSEQSTELAARWYLTFDGWVRDLVAGIEVRWDGDHGLTSLGPIFEIVLAYVFIVMRPICAGVFRLLAVLRHPLAGARAFMANWRHQVFGVSLFSPAELVPNTRMYSLHDIKASLDGIWQHTRQSWKTSLRILKYILVPLGAAIASVLIAASQSKDGATAGFIEASELLLKLIISGGSTGFLVIGFVVGVVLILYNPRQMYGYIEVIVLSLLAMFLRVGVKTSCVVWYPLVLSSARREEVRMPVDVLIEYSHEGALPKLVRTIAFGGLISLLACNGRFLGLPFALTPPFLDGSVAALVWQIAVAATCVLVLVRDYAVLDTARFTMQEGRWTPARVDATVTILSRLVRLCVLVVLASSLAMIYPLLRQAFVDLFSR